MTVQKLLHTCNNKILRPKGTTTEPPYVPLSGNKKPPTLK